MSGPLKTRPTSSPLSQSQRVRRLEALTAAQHEQIRRLDDALAWLMGVIQVTVSPDSPLDVNPRKVQITARAAYAQACARAAQSRSTDHSHDNGTSPDAEEDPPTPDAPILGQFGRT